MAKITNRLEEIQYWNKKKSESVKKSQDKKKLQPVVYKQKKQTPIRKVSKKQSSRLIKYLRVRAEWFKNSDNQYCKLNMRPECTKEKPLLAEDVHHTAGKDGEMLFNAKYWLPGCRLCHRLAHDNHQEAKEKGVMKSKHILN